MGTPSLYSYPQDLNRWLNVNEVLPIGRTRTFITVPAFTLPVTAWTGHSEKVVQINFAVPNNIALQLETSKLNGVSVVGNLNPQLVWYVRIIPLTDLVSAIVDADGSYPVKRWSLLPHQTESLNPPQFPLYDGEPLTGLSTKQTFAGPADYAYPYTFALEGWTKPETVIFVPTAQAAFNIYTSLLGNSDTRYGVDSQLGIVPDAPIFSFGNTNPNSPGVFDLPLFFPQATVIPTP